MFIQILKKTRETSELHNSAKGSLFGGGCNTALKGYAVSYTKELGNAGI